MSRVHTTEDVIEVFEERDGWENPVLTAADVAERMGASTPTVNNRIGELLESGELQCFKLGSTRVYYLADEELAVVNESEVTTPTDVFDLLESSGRRLRIGGLLSFVVAVLAAFAPSLLLIRPSVPAFVYVLVGMGIVVGSLTVFGLLMYDSWSRRAVRNSLLSP